MIKHIIQVALILLLPLALNAESKAKLGVIKQMFNVRVVTVDTMTKAKEQINYGYIVADESRVVDIYARFSGYVTLLYADSRYKKVTSGEALAQIYSPKVYRAKEDYIHSLAFNSKQKSSQMVDSAKKKLSLLGVSAKEIEELTKSKKASEFTTIYAPQGGWIFYKGINQGGSFNISTKLFSIVNIESVWAEVKIFQNEIKNLKNLTNFNIKIKGVEEFFSAKNPLLYPMIDPKEATATLRLEVDNPRETLKVGSYIKLHSSSPAVESIVIPRTATIRKDGKWYAFLQTEFKGEYEPVEIEIEPLDNIYYRVNRGLHKGDVVVNNALFMMDSDAQINGAY